MYNIDAAYQGNPLRKERVRLALEMAQHLANQRLGNRALDFLHRTAHIEDVRGTLVMVAADQDWLDIAREVWNFMGESSTHMDTVD